MITVKNQIAAELYDIIHHCRDDTLENFKQDLLNHLAEEADREAAKEEDDDS